MTSEIVILNKNTIVMAADSAVTVGGSKTYMGANKLFKLSDNPPMGIMIYGASDFENVSMETLIKEYNRKTDFSDKQDIIKIKDDFLKFIAKNTENSNFDLMIKSELEPFKIEIMPKIEHLDYLQLVDFLNSRINEKLPAFLEDYNDIIEKYDIVFKNMIPDTIESKNEEEIFSLIKLVFFEYLINIGTGVVIAGFNETNLFPSVVNFKLCLNNNGNIEIKDYREYINFKGNGILPFAQTDVITTFVTGMDLSLTNSIVNYFNIFFNECLDELKHEFNSTDKLKNESLTASNEILDNFKLLFEKRLNEFNENISKLKVNNSNPILESIGSLPKEELANIAEHLIRITSLKREMDSDLQSVGGNIDVAIISKGDGFNWKNKRIVFETNLDQKFLEIT